MTMETIDLAILLSIVLLVLAVLGLIADALRPTPAHEDARRRNPRRPPMVVPHPFFHARRIP